MTRLMPIVRREYMERVRSKALVAVAQESAVQGFVKARPESAFAVFHPHDGGPAAAFARRVDATALVFPRQVVRCGALLADMPVGDRVTPIVAEAQALGSSFRELVIETPDTNDGKALASLARPLEPHLRRGLARAGVTLDDASVPERLHVFLRRGHGVPRGPHPGGLLLALAHGNPAASHAARGAVALHAQARRGPCLLRVGEEGSGKRLRAGMTAVDLGASPGGWTWQLVRRGFMVTAVDNGPMDAALLESGQVKHRREDGFRFRPAEPVDWMVCDMVESPSRVCVLSGTCHA